MSLTVLAAARSKNLCTLQQVKDRLSLSGSGEDAKLQTLLRAVSAAISAHFGRELARQRYLETVAGLGRRRILLSQLPVDPDSLTLTVNGLAVTDFTVEDALAGTLYRESGWPQAASHDAEQPEENVAITYYGGWVSPDLLADWTADAIVTAGSWIRATSASPQPLLFEVTTAGQLGATEPSWPADPGDTVASGTAVLTARDAYEVPLDIQEAALLTVIVWRSGAPAAAPNIASERFETNEITYFAGTAGRDSALPRAAQALLGSYL